MISDRDMKILNCCVEMVLVKYAKDMLFDFNLLLRPLNSNVRACIRRTKTIYVI